MIVLVFKKAGLPMATNVSLMCPKCGRYVFAEPPRSVNRSLKDLEVTVRVICLECGYKFRHRLILVDNKWKSASHY